MRITRRFRAVSTVTLSFLISVLVLMVIVYSVASALTTAGRSIAGLKNTIVREHHQQLVQIVANKTPEHVYFTNLGPYDLVIDKVLIRTYVGNVEVKDPTELCESRVIPSAGRIKCVHVDGEYIAFITVDGLVARLYEPVLKGQPLRLNVVKISMLKFNYTSPGVLRDVFNVSSELVAKPYRREYATVNYTGMNSTNILVLEREFNNTYIQTSTRGVAFGVLLVGYDPSWVSERMEGNANSPPRFTVMLIAPRLGSSENITIGGVVYPFTSNGTRIIVNNLTGTIRIFRNATLIACSSSVQGVCGSYPPAIGVWYYGIDLNMRVQIEGTATYVAFYNRTGHAASPTRATSYLPYLFIGDLNGNGLNELVFITEDATYGNRTVINDMYAGVDLTDWSVVPLTIRLIPAGRQLGSQDGSIDGNVFSGLVLYLVVFFHDNSHPDEDQLSDNDRTDWVLRIALIDERGEEIVIREFRYQEICVYHKTRIVDFTRDNYFARLSMSIYINLPDRRKYWVAIVFQDSYGTGVQNDVDFTIGIELVGILPIHR